MARVARRAGQRGRTIPAPPRPRSGQPGVTLRLGPDLVAGAWTLGRGARHRGVAGGAVRGESEQVRRTAAMHRRGSTGVPGRVPAGDDSGGSGGAARRPTPPRPQVSLAVADGAADVSPVDPARDHRHRRRARRRDASSTAAAPTSPGAVAADAESRAPRSGRRRTSSPTARATRSPRRPTNADDEEAKASSTFTTVTPDDALHAVHRPARRHDRRRRACRSASTSTTRSPTRPPSRATCWSPAPRPTDGVVELDERLRGALPALAVLAGEHRRSRSTRTSTAWTSARASGARRTARCPSTIGAKHVSVADAGTHTLQVYDGDQLVQTYPMSAGSADNPTHNGRARRHRVLPQHHHGLQHLRPGRRRPGGYRADVEYAVRISNNGEFVHAAPWSVGAAGQQQRLARLHQPVHRAGRLVLQLLPARGRRGDPELRAARRSLPPTATSTTGPSRGTSGRPAAR